MAKLIKNGKIYAPEYLGINDILTVGKKIIKISKRIDVINCPFEVEVIDADGKIIVPGFIDQHVHILGGGGEGGFHTRTPEVMMSQIVEAGITTIMGLLGTDGTTRSLESLLAKAKGLENEGITTYILTGSYEVPTVTLTGNIRKDIMFIDKVLGTKIALSDHRSSHVTKEELIRLASNVRVAGMLSNKPGLIVIHIGNSNQKLNMIMEIIRETDIPINHFIPTHVTKTRELFDQAIKFATLGGRIDISADGAEDSNERIRSSKAVAECIENGLPIENITMSSDGHGSMPRFDSKGNTIGLTAASLDSLHLSFKEMVNVLEIDMTSALKVITSNVAKVLDIFPEKGCLHEGSDADILVLDNDLNIDMVLACGNKMMEKGKTIVKGTFEE